MRSTAYSARSQREKAAAADLLVVHLLCDRYILACLYIRDCIGIILLFMVGHGEYSNDG